MVANTAEGPVRLLSIILFCTLGVWDTDSLHGSSPAWIALGAAVVCLMPFSWLVPFKDLQTRVIFASTINITAILSIVPVLVETGAGDMLGKAILSLVPFKTGAIFRSFMVHTGLGAISGMATNAPGAPAVLGPRGRVLHSGRFSALMNQVIGYCIVTLVVLTPSNYFWWQWLGYLN